MKGLKIAKAIHSMIRVFNEAKALAFYDIAFGLKLADRFDFDGFSLLYLRNDESTFEVELTVNQGAEPYTHGTGYGHLAVSVEDIDAEYARFTEAGLAPTPVKDFMYNDVKLARFFFVTDPDGYKIEVLQREGRYV